MKRILATATLSFSCVLLFAQEKALPMKMDFEEYDPPSTLVVEEHHLTHAKFPFIDIHNHQGDWNTADLSGLVKAMDKLNMGVMNNLSGRGFGNSGSDYLEKSLENIKSHYPNRFILFTNIDFGGIDDPQWTQRTIVQLEKDVKEGAKG